MKVHVHEGPMLLTGVGNATVLSLRGNVNAKMLAEMRDTYLRLIGEHGDIVTITMIELTEMPKMGAEERKIINEMSTLTLGKTIAVQWIEGSGMVAATVRAMLAGFNLFYRSSAVKTVVGMEQGLALIAESGKLRGTNQALRDVIAQTRQLHITGSGGGSPRPVG